MAAYVVAIGLPIPAAAKKFGMSAGTLKDILGGGRLSDNMLSRVRSSLVAEISVSKRRTIFPSDWRRTSSLEVAEAIAIVSEKLIFLKKVIESNNLIHAEESPIDEIQIAQLIAMLISTLEALRAPVVDKKQTQGFFKWLAKFAKFSVEKGAEKVVVDAMSGAVDAGVEMVKRLGSGEGLPDLGDLIG